MKWNLPNSISILRALLAPLFLFLLLSGNQTAIFVSVCVFVAAAVTDYIDGWLARKYQEVSPWGVFFDPLADKVLTATAFIAFAWMDMVPWWMVFVVLLRDVLMTLLRIYADAVQQPVITSRSAKLKTFLQMVYIIYILLMYLFSFTGFFPMVKTVATAALHPAIVYFGMLIITILTFWTAIEYFFNNRVLLLQLLRRGVKTPS